MSYTSDGSLTFRALRGANLARLPEFTNRKGEPAHSQPDGSDWSLGEWSNAVMGELGEAANLIKKIQRRDISLDEARDELADELADVQTYLDILAYRAGIDLGAATRSKWNRVSERVGSRVRLESDDWRYVRGAEVQASGATEDQPVARVQPVESAQQPCCGLCADECRLESAQQREPNDDERVEYERLVKALRNAREAIARLDEDALGRDQREGWPYRDELLAEIDAALGGQQKGAGE